MEFISVLFSGKINLNCKTEMAPLVSTLSPKSLWHIFLFFTKPGDVDAKSSRMIYRFKNRGNWILSPGLERRHFEKKSSVMMKALFHTRLLLHPFCRCHHLCIEEMMHKEEEGEMQPEGVQSCNHTNLMTSLVIISLLTLMAPSISISCPLVCFHFLQMCDSLPENSESWHFVCVLSQLDPSLEAKVNVQRQSVILEEEFEVSGDRLSTLRRDGRWRKLTGVQQAVLVNNMCFKREPSKCFKMFFYLKKTPTLAGWRSKNFGIESVTSQSFILF